MKYRIIRMYKDDSDSLIVKTGLTLEQAQAHCRDPETSSSTCTTIEGIARTRLLGEWFEGYDHE